MGIKGVGGGRIGWWESKGRGGRVGGSGVKG